MDPIYKKGVTPHPSLRLMSPTPVDGVSLASLSLARGADAAEVVSARQIPTFSCNTCEEVVNLVWSPWKERLSPHFKALRILAEKTAHTRLISQRLDRMDRAGERTSDIEALRLPAFEYSTEFKTSALFNTDASRKPLRP